MSATVPYDPDNPRIEDSQSFLMQLPMAQKKFSAKQQQALAKLDPDKIAADMKADYEKLALEAPEMAGKVSDVHDQYNNLLLRTVESGGAKRALRKS